MRRKRERVITETGTTSLTKQSFKDECDVNVVVKNHAQSGMWDHLNPRTPTYGDFTASRNLADALQLVDEAQALFDELPAEVRSACNNKPEMLLANLADPEHAAALVELGLPLQNVEVPLSEQIATGVAAGMAEAPGDATPPGEEGQTSDTKTVSPSS